MKKSQKYLPPNSWKIQSSSVPFSPMQDASLNLMLWLDAADRESMDQGTVAGSMGPPIEGSSVGHWRDKSGNGFHAVKTGDSVSYSQTALNGTHPGLDFNNRGKMELQNSESFDSWEQLTVIVVYEWAGSAGTTWHNVINKGGTGWSESSWILQTMNNNTPHTQGTGFIMGSVNGGNFRLNGGIKTVASVGNPNHCCYL